MLLGMSFADFSSKNPLFSLPGASSFQNLVNEFSDVIDKLANSVEMSKIKAIGSKNALNSINKEKVAKKLQIEAQIAEKTKELDQLKTQRESLSRKERELNDLLDNINNFRM